MKIILLVILLLGVALNLYATPVRVHCQPNGIVFEDIAEEQLQEVYQPMDGEQIVIIDKSAVPQFNYVEQLSCQNGKLIFDPSFKPAYAIAAEQRQEQLKQAQAALDAELGKADPDIITVLRLQRSIEKIKKGEVEQ